MSARNKLANKQTRRYERSHRPSCLFPRRAISTIDLASSAALLCNHKERLGARGRKYLMRTRADIIIMPTPEVRRVPAVKLAEKLASLTLVQLGRRRKQFASRAAGAGYKLRGLTSDSRFRAALQAYQDANIFALKQTNAEIRARFLHATKQLA